MAMNCRSSIVNRPAARRIRRAETHKSQSRSMSMGAVVSVEPQKAVEQHYQIPEIAKKWGLSEDSVRSLFKGEPGVLTIARPGTAKKRRYVSMRVPESVLLRVHRRLSARAA
jgi:hypothetical protein